jgi:hypothetical protein
LEEKIEAARKQLAKYKGEIPIQEAIFIASNVSGVRIHLLKPDEVSNAIAHAKGQLQAVTPHTIPPRVAREIKVASLEKWGDLSPDTRAYVASLWTPKTGADMVLTTIASAQPKEKILELIRSILSMAQDRHMIRSG